MFDGASFSNFLMDEKLECNGLVSDKDLNLWGVDADGIFVFTRNGEYRRCGVEDGLPEMAYGSRICLGSDGILSKWRNGIRWLNNVLVQY
jgi:hypothetical protein